MVAGYWHTLGGVPASNIRLLQGWKAERIGIDEAVLEWLPAHATGESTVIVYFAGQALVTNTGDVLLVPYERSPSVTARLEDEKHRHGLMTYYLLLALRGECDSNRDGTVTLAELAAYIGQKVVWAAKSQFGADQRPLISPPLKQDEAPRLLS